jgi:hypothetical protein
MTEPYDWGMLTIFEVDLDIWAETITLTYSSSGVALRPTAHIPGCYFVWMPGFEELAEKDKYAEMLSVELTERVFGRE